MTDDRLNGLTALEHGLLILRHLLELAPVPDVDAGVGLVNTPVTQINIHRAWLDLGGLHQLGCLTDLLLERMPIKRIAVKSLGTNHQVVLQRRCYANLDAEFIGLLALAFVDAADFWCVPAVKLGLTLQGLLAGALQHDPTGLALRFIQHGLEIAGDVCSLAPDLTLQPGNDGALALDGTTHTPKLACMCITPGLAAQLCAFLGKSLFQCQSGVLGHFNQFGTCRLQQSTVGGVGNGLVLDRRIHDDALELLGLDQLKTNGDVDGLRQQRFGAVFAQKLPKLDPRGGITRLALYKVGKPREELPAWRFVPAGNDTLVGFVEGMLQIQQGDHDAQRYSGTPSIGLGRNSLAKQIKIGHRNAVARFAGKHVGHRGFDLLPRHARGQHRQRLAKIKHVIQAGAEEIFGGGVAELWRELPENNP